MTEPTERPERCELCRWWESQRSDIGTCHRHAPISTERVNPWPKTTADAWCSEYDPPPKATMRARDGLLRVEGRKNRTLLSVTGERNRW